MTVAMNLVFICRQYNFAAKVEEAVNAISWAHYLGVLLKRGTENGTENGTE